MWCGACALNKGGLALLFFEHQAADLVHEDFLDLDLMSFGLPFRDFSSLAHGATGYLDLNRSGRARPYLQPGRLHDGVS
jgi:hypothetical protein